ncbi:N-6 DNA methylase [bacterium]|nr:N-6 DNA methylase [bacterium]
MPLSWNEIRSRAVKFANEWKTESSEASEAQTFWNEFFNVFGITRRRVATFETKVHPRPDKGGIIDLLWKGTLLVEHKSFGKDLDRAYQQAIDYFPGIEERDLPQYIIVSDFARLRLYDLDLKKTHEILLIDLPQHIELFAFIAGYENRSFGQEDPVNAKAAARLGELHDMLKESSYKGHKLEVMMVRLLFCMFADTTGIFQRGQFREYLELRTRKDGIDLGLHLELLFEVLNQIDDERMKHLDEHLTAFPYVNGKLFEEQLPIASFNMEMRDKLLDCCGLDWSRISPAIFGSIFQSVMDPVERRHIGGHYTTETNILKALNPLFLDDLQLEYKEKKNNHRALKALQRKIAGIKILDPACGCGNFLSVAYKELRRLEIKILLELRKDTPELFSLETATAVNISQFYGIELKEFPSQIAQVSMWLTDHQMNIEAANEFGLEKSSIPLKTTPNIICENALTYKWSDLILPNELTYIVGNPPFVGAKHLDAEQTTDRNRVFNGTPNSGILDYVCCWYRLAAEYMENNPRIKAAFVSTNSITQGEQVGALWGDLIKRSVRIIFAHRTFQWMSETRGQAVVQCVIIGFALNGDQEKWLFEYENPKSEPKAMLVSQINPYLVDAPTILLSNRRSPICDVPEIGIGNQPIDNGYYLFTPVEKNEFLQKEPTAKKWFRKWIGADEFINEFERWCLYLKNCSPHEIRSMPYVKARVDAVREFRLKSIRSSTRELAQRPTRFQVENTPESDYLVIPGVSSEMRIYMPISFVSTDILSSNANFVIGEANLFHFGVLTSFMHMAWVRAVAGRLESRYRYSKGIVYNNFPWPDPTPRQKTSIENAAEEVLEARKKWSSATLADLYDPVTMPPNLVKAHRKLDRAVDAAYGKRSFSSEAERVAFLFAKYQEIASPLLPKERKRPRPRRKK